MRAPRAASSLIPGESAPLPTATPAQAALRHLTAGPHPKLPGRWAAEGSIHGHPPPRRNPAAQQADPEVTPGRGLAAEAALVRADPGASLPPRAPAGLPVGPGDDRQAGVALQPRRNRL